MHLSVRDLKSVNNPLLIQIFHLKIVFEVKKRLRVGVKMKEILAHPSVCFLCYYTQDNRCSLRFAVVVTFNRV